MGDLVIARSKAWATRRRKYGPRGHAGSYSRSPAPAASLPDTWGMLNLIVRLHAEGVLTEGQVAKATGYDRVEVRRLQDEFHSAPTDFMTTEECETRGLTPYAVYGGKVYSFVDRCGRCVVHGTPMYRLAFANPTPPSTEQLAPAHSHTGETE